MLTEEQLQQIKQQATQQIMQHVMPTMQTDPAAARSCCHCAIGTKGDPSPEVLLAARQFRRW